MPINNITQNISAIPQAGHRGIDVQTIFVNKQEAFQDALTDVFVGQINTLRTQLNAFVNETNTVATQVNTNATNASTSATTATTQAGIATTKAGEASASASQTLNYRNQAETFANQASASASSVDASNIVHRTGDEDVDGIKNFLKSPIVPTPISGNDAVNKDYVDSVATLNINDLTDKTTPVDLDELVIADSATSFNLKKLSWANLKATLVTYLSMGFVFSYGNSGYIKMPNWLGGWVFQWVAITAGTGTSFSFSFPITFPNVCNRVIISGEGASLNTEYWSASVTNASTFNVYKLNTNARTATVFAIGH